MARLKTPPTNSPKNRLLFKNPLSDRRKSHFKNQKALGKGGHHLAPFDPLTRLYLALSRSVTHLTIHWGPPVKGVMTHTKIVFVNKKGKGIIFLTCYVLN